MNKNERMTKALDWAKNVVGRILDVWVERDFVEIVGQEGGDTRTFRYYDDGTVVER